MHDKKQPSLDYSRFFASFVSRQLESDPFIQRFASQNINSERFES